MLPDSPDLDHLTQVISHATAPAFLLGAVAGFLSILVSRLERTIDRHHVVRAAAQGSPEAEKMERLVPLLAKRAELLNDAIYLAVLSALCTAALLIVSFGLAFLEIQHTQGLAVLFVVALVLLMGALVQFTREVRVSLRISLE
jgi:hypothetical protein